MVNVIAETEVRILDFIQISAVFLLVMLCFLGLKNNKVLNTSLMILFVVQCAFFLFFHAGLPLKLFTALMLLTTVIVEYVINRRRKLNAL